MHKYIKNFSGVTIGIILPSLLFAESGQRVVLSVSSETEWIASLNEENSQIVLDGKEITANVVANRQEGFILKFETKTESTTQVIQVDCKCVDAVEIYRGAFLIIDSSPNEENTPSLSDKPSRDIISDWWNRPPSVDLHNRPQVNIDKTNEYTLPRFVDSLSQENITLARRTEQSEQPILPASDRNQYETSKIGINIPQETTSDETPKIQTCPIRKLYADNAEQSDASLNNFPSNSRNQVFNSAGELSTNEVLTHAGRLIKLGLFIESAQILSLVHDQNFDAQVLYKISKIGSGHRNIRFTKQETEACDGLLEIWRIASGASITSNLQTSSLATIQFKALPSVLQDILFESISFHFATTPGYNEIERYIYDVRPSSSDNIRRGGPSSFKSETLLLRQSNRDYPERVIDLLKSSNEPYPQELISLSTSVRTQHQETALWKDIITAEVQLDIRSGRYGVAISKIDLMVTDGIDHGSINPLMETLVEALLELGTPTEVLAFHLSEQTKNWPIEHRNAIASYIHALGISNMLSAGEEVQAPHRQVRSGYIIGPNQTHLPQSNAEQMNDILTSDGVRQALSQSEEFRAQLYQTLRIE